MKNKLLIISLIALLMSSCDGMNDNVNIYLDKGETVYIAKSDSVKVYSGLNRFKLQFWISDPRATDMVVSSRFMNGDIKIEIAEDRDYTQPIEQIIECREGSITMNLTTCDNKGNKSIKDEYSVVVYGEDYISTLAPKIVKSVSRNNETNELTINWGKTYSEIEYGVKLKYLNISGEKVECQIHNNELGTKTILTDVDLDSKITYQTLFLPESDCIDVISTPDVEIK